MDKTTQYRRLIKNLLIQHAKMVTHQCFQEMETLLSFDEKNDQYLWLQVGWQNDHRVHGITIHLRLHHGKIWVEQDWTEPGIAVELLKSGVSKDEIVLGFLHPKKRPLTEFAVA